MRALFTLCLTFITTLAIARGAPDSIAVSKLYSTNWTLTGKYHIGNGIFHRKRKIENPSEMGITIYSNEIHTTLVTGKYQVCAARHRNRNEFWLDCASPDQYIYRVISIEGDELIIDVLTRPPGKLKYVRISRNHYTRRKS